MKSRLVIALTAIALLGLPACSNDGEAQANGHCPAPAGKVTVTPETSGKFDPWSMTVTGLPAGRSVTLELTTTDGQGSPFASSTDFTVPDNGTIDTRTTTPTGGSYAKADRSGPLTSMTKDGRAALLADGQKLLDYQVKVVADGCALAAGSFTHGKTADLRPTSVATVAKDGVAAFYATGSTPGTPVVLILGGGEGGFSAGELLMALNRRGYPVAASAYFKGEGLPPQAEGLPLEYFDKLLAWLVRQPGLTDRKVVVFGASLGSQPAQYLAVAHPDQVGGVVIASGSYRYSHSWTDPGKSVWTLGGKPVPGSPHPETGALDANIATRIPLEKFPGKVLTICGTRDAVWNACGSGRIIAQHRTGLPTTQVIAEGAGHEVDGLVPDVAGSAGVANDGNEVVEAFPGATALGRQKAWDALITFLEQISTKP